MAADGVVKEEQVNLCCALLNKKYQDVLQRRNKLREGLKALEPTMKKLESEKNDLRKACDEERARTQSEREEKEKELKVRVTLEKVISDLKSEISSLKQNKKSEVQDAEELRLLHCRVSEADVEIVRLKEALGKEKAGADIEKKIAAEEMDKVAEERKVLKAEKSRADEEKKLANIERQKAETLRTHMESLKKDMYKERSEMVLEMDKLKEANEKLEVEKQMAVKEKEHVDSVRLKAEQQIELAEISRKNSMDHADCLSQQLDEEKTRANDLSQHLAEEKSRVFSLSQQLEDAKHNVEELQKTINELTSSIKVTEKQMEIREKDFADLERSKAEEQRKHAEISMLRALDEKARANQLCQQLEEAKNKIEELEKARPELMSSTKATETLSHLQSKIKDKELDESQVAVESPCREDVKRIVDVDNEKLGIPKQHSDQKIVDAEEITCLEVYNKVTVGNHIADKLFQRLELDKQVIEKLQTQIRILETCGNVDGSAVLVDFNKKNESEEIILLKKQLKFEKKQVKFAKEEAKLEKTRRLLLHEDLLRLKNDLVQFSHRLGILNSQHTSPTEGIDDLMKTCSSTKTEGPNLHREVLDPEHIQMSLQDDFGIARCNPRGSHVSDCFEQVSACRSLFLPVSGETGIETVTGTKSKLESLIRGSDKQLLQSSAINSSTDSFSDRELVGSQERGVLSVTTSAKLGEENLEPQPNNIDAFAAKNSMLGPLQKSFEGKGSGSGRKRKKNLDNSFGYVYTEVNRLLRSLPELFDRHIRKSLRDKGPLGLVQRYDFLNKHHRSCKKRKTSPYEAGGIQQLCEQKEGEKVKVNGSEVDICLQASVPATILTANTKSFFPESCKGQSNSSDGSNQDMAAFAELVDKGYMRLFELDNAADEERYQAAMMTPMSPTLPDVGYVDSIALCSERPQEVFSDGAKGMVHPYLVDGTNFETDSQKLKYGPTISYNPVQQEFGNVVDSPKEAERENGLRIPASVGKVGNCGGGVSNMKELSNMSMTDNKGIEILCESKKEAAGCFLPLNIIVFSGTLDRSNISRVFAATKACVARLSVASRKEWMVPEVVHALLQEDIFPKEKACVFLSLLLHPISYAVVTTYENLLTKEYLICLKSFAAHIKLVISDPEMRRKIADLFNLDVLLSLIEDFLVNRKVLLHSDASVGSLPQHGSRIDFRLGGMSVLLSVQSASYCQLVAGSCILASICSALGQIGSMCEISYNIFRNCRCDSSLVLTVLHVFAHLGGEEYLNLNDYTLMMSVIKSVVAYFERDRSETAAYHTSPSLVCVEFPPCVKCPFSQGLISLNDIISLLLKKLRSCTLSGTKDLLETVDSLKACRLPNRRNLEGYSSFEDVPCVTDRTSDTSCSLNYYGVASAQIKHVSRFTLCHLSDIVSLVELIACRMSWYWSCERIVPQLLEILESCLQDTFSAAIVTLLGEIGRMGVDRYGYEDVGVQNLRCRLCTFLNCCTARSLRFPLQSATAYALLRLVSYDLKVVTVSDNELPDGASDFTAANLVRNWFLSLCKEQQSLAMCLFQSARG